MTATELLNGQLAQIPAAAIVAGPNDRGTFDQGALESLAASIARDGLAQPPTVRPLEGGQYQIVAGERRVRACRLLGWDMVPCFVRQLDDGAASNVMLVENLVRVDLDPLEEGRAFRARIDAGASVGDIAELVGVTQRTVRARLDLLRLGPDAQALVSSGNLTLAAAAQMVGLDGDRQNIALRTLNAGNLSPAAFIAVADKLRREQETEPMFSADLFWSVEEYVAHGEESADMARKADDQLTTAQVAEVLGVKVGSVRQYIVRGTFPTADGYFGSTPWWHRSTVETWKLTRRGPGRPRQTGQGEA